MTTAGLTVRIWNDAGIGRRDGDGYINATAMCQANGKMLGHYRELDRTREYMRALADSMNVKPETLMDIRQGGTPALQGTWVHPRLAVDLARWISPEFAVWMDGWFLEALQSSSPSPDSDPVHQNDHRLTKYEWRLASLGIAMEAHGLIDFDAWVQGQQPFLKLPPKPQTQPKRKGLPHAWPCNPEDHAKAAVRLIATARTKQVSVITARDVQQWRPFGKRQMTAHEARQFLREAATRYRLGVMVPGRRRGNEQLLLAA